MKKIWIVALIAVAALPVAALTTFFLVPLWRWFEAKTQIESLGHSGPAGWCFLAVYLLVLAASLGWWFFLLGSKPRRDD